MMKQILIFILLFSLSISYIKAQESEALVNKMETLISERDSLKRINQEQQNSINLYKENTITEKKNLQSTIDQLKIQLKDENMLQDKRKRKTDSLQNIIIVKQDENKEKQSRYDSLKSEYDIVLEKLQKFERKNIAQIEKNLQEKTDSISEFIKTLNHKKNQIDSIQKEMIKQVNQANENGQQQVFKNFQLDYSNSNFDDLITSSTERTVTRDLPYGKGNGGDTYKVLQELSWYFSAKKVTEQPYNEKRVQEAQAQLNQITVTSSEVEKLKEIFSNYEICTEALGDTIKNIIDFDNKFKVPDDDESQSDKLKDILAELSKYFRNYRFDFKQYPYLSNIVLELMNSKQRNANTDISHLLDKL